MKEPVRESLLIRSFEALNNKLYLGIEFLCPFNLLQKAKKTDRYRRVNNLMFQVLYGIRLIASNSHILGKYSSS